jgi:hypothetical protein
VHWQLLDDEAVSRARRENKLILLNVGFRACHCMQTHPPIPLPYLSCFCDRVSLTQILARLPPDISGLLLQPAGRAPPQHLLRPRHRRQGGAARHRRHLHELHPGRQR